MARLDEAKVEEIKQFLQRLERLVPPPNGAVSTPPEMSRQQPGAESAPDVKLPASAIERTAQHALLFARTELGAILLVAAVSALLSTCISVMVIRGMLAPQIAGTENVYHSQPEQVQSAILPTSEPVKIAPEPTPAPAEPATPDPAANVDVVSNASVATTERAAAEPELPPKPEPPTTLPSAPETDATPPQSIAEEPEQERADTGVAPQSTPTESAPSPVPPPAPVIPDAAQDLQRGQAMLSSGNIGEARLLLESAAGRGNGEAALLLGSTYDALRSQDFPIAGVTHDAILARHWYERAAALGAQEAQQRLLNLDSSPVPEWRRLWLTNSTPRRACSYCGPARTKCTPRAGARCGRAR